MLLVLCVTLVFLLHFASNDLRGTFWCLRWKLRAERSSRKSTARGFASASASALVFFSAVYDVYDFAKSSFKRSPNAPYLTFTYRDVARTFQGILKALEGFGGSAPTEALLLESFLHEVARVFEDKLKIQLQKDLLRQELRRLRSFRGMTVTPNDSEESEAPRRSSEAKKYCRHCRV